MNIADIVFISLVAGAFFVGYRNDAVRQFCGVLGTIIGFIVAGLLYERLAFLTQNSLIRTVVLLAILTGTSFLCADLLVVLGRWLRRKIPREFRKSRTYKWIASAVTGFGSIVILTMLIVASSGLLPRVARAQIQNGSVIGFFSNNVPIPPPVANFAALRQPFSAPQVFAGEEATFTATSDDVLSDAYKGLDAASDAAKSSVVEITTWGCGSIAYGSGFIVDDRHVITNAHVIAGGDKISIRSGDAALTARPVWFDPQLDVAMLYTQSPMSGRPVTTADQDAQPGSIAAHLGFARQTGLSVEDVVVLQKLNATGFDIYRRQQITRQVYALRGEVIPGNSGGPVINASGKVIGILIGHSTTQNRTGYAIAINQVADLFSKSATFTRTVSSGECVAS